MKSIPVFLLLALAIACGDEQSTSLEVCAEEPPFNSTYGPPTLETIRTPDEPPYTTIEYRWSCVSTEITSPGDAPGGAAYVGVVQTWQRTSSNCWIELGEAHNPDPRCGHVDEEKPLF